MTVCEMWFTRPSKPGVKGHGGSSSLEVAGALRELQRFSDRELADIGLGRLDLTEEGLVIAGWKRRRG